MKKYKFEIDSSTTIEVSLGIFGDKNISVNNKKIPEVVKMDRDVPFTFLLEDGRSAIATYKREASSPRVELRINNELMLETAKDTVKTCEACKTENKPNDTFCVKCGGQLPSSEVVAIRRKVAGARSAILAVAAMFAIFGLLMFAVEKGEGSAGVLVLNWFLASIMLGLWFWAKKAPLPAIIVAAGVYGVVIVINTIVDPKSISQGIAIKVMTIMFFFNGIKSALEAKNAGKS